MNVTVKYPEAVVLASRASEIPSLDSTYGAMFIGMVVAATLWGMGTIQAYWYFTIYHEDPLRLKVFVLFTWVFDTIHQALLTRTIYFYVITSYFNPQNLNFLLWSLIWQAAFEVILTICVQLFFLMRIWILSHGKWIFVIPPSLFVAGKFVLGWVWIVQSARAGTVILAEKKARTVSELVNGLTAGADILLAAMMVYLLVHSRTGIKQSDNLLFKLTWQFYTINTGVITSVVAIITLITSIVFPNDLIFGALWVTICRLYLNTMLASLNARKSLKAIYGTHVHMSEMSADVNQRSDITRVLSMDANQPVIFDNHGDRDGKASDLQVYFSKQAEEA